MENHQILVVDDDPITARFIASLLQEHGYDVLVAEDGAHALEIVERHELVVEVVEPQVGGDRSQVEVVGLSEHACIEAGHRVVAM